MWKEWPLVAFTIAGQMAVGVFLLAGIPLALAPLRLISQPDAATRGLWIALLALVLALLAAAALVSFFHLHHHLRARYVLSNLRTSWLSREIFFELGFMALVALAVFLLWRRPMDVVLLKTVLFAAGFAGIMFLGSMSKLYMLPTAPAWNQAYTPLSFIMTALTLGAMAIALFIDVLVGGRQIFGYLLLLSFPLVGAKIVFPLFIAPGHGIYGPRSGPSLRPPAETSRRLHLGRLALRSAGLVLIGAAIMTRDVEYRVATGSGVTGLLAVAFVLVLASEVAGRFLFYGLLTRPGR
jgi:anaerobic dimethyl sulfoxide reductase subunit C (anchor subunit)